MPETKNTKNYKIIRTTVNNVLFNLHPVSNYGLTRRIFLNDRNNVVALPEDWALGIFQDEGAYALYREGAFTFDDNEGIAKAAFEAGVYFDDKVDFAPADTSMDKDIALVLQRGNRTAVLAAIQKYGKQRITDVAIENLDSIPQGTVTLLENELQIQLVLD